MLYFVLAVQFTYQKDLKCPLLPSHIHHINKKELKSWLGTSGKMDYLTSPNGNFLCCVELKIEIMVQLIFLRCPNCFSNTVTKINVWLIINFFCSYQKDEI